MKISDSYRQEAKALCEKVGRDDIVCTFVMINKGDIVVGSNTTYDQCIKMLNEAIGKVEKLKRGSQPCKLN